MGVVKDLDLTPEDLLKVLSSVVSLKKQEQEKRESLQEEAEGPKKHSRLMGEHQHCEDDLAMKCGCQTAERLRLASSALEMSQQLLENCECEMRRVQRQTWGSYCSN